MTKVSDEYQYLYHYTDFKGLCGILESQCLWATNSAFLNDTTESRLLFEEEKLYPIIEEAIRNAFLISRPIYSDIINSKKFNEENRPDITKLITKMRESMGNGEPFYIMSFCGTVKNDIRKQNENGLLSMWRAYGQDGGFAIVFNTAEIEKQLQNESQQHRGTSKHLRKILYSGEDKEFQDGFSDEINTIRNYVKSNIESHLKRSFPVDDNSEIYTAVLGCITGYKHRGFFEENEIRIVCHLPKLMPGYPLENDTQESKKINYREGDGYQIPYIKLFEGQKLPIEKIIVGPHKDKEKRAAWLMIKLKSLGLSDVKVTVSDIPYIGNK